MPVIFCSLSTCVVLLGFTLVAGCGSEPVLISKSAAIPAGVDLTGSWEIRGEPGAMRLPDSRDGSEPIVRSGRVERRKPRRRAAGASAQVFLEFGEKLKISQTAHGLFISFDRSVVEEYTFGENRRIAIGPIEAIRVSGWEGASFVVETLDDDGSTLFEHWQLGEHDAVLTRNIRIARGDKETFSLQQVFDRQ